MIANLTSEQVRTLNAHPNEPMSLLDPESNRTYVLLPAELYEQLKALLEDNYHLRDTYPAQFRSALRAGWDDPAMDEYNNYDENYRESCQ